MARLPAVRLNCVWRSTRGSEAKVMPGDGAEVGQQRAGGADAKGGEGVHGAVERGVAEQMQFGKAVGLVEHKGADRGPGG